MSIVRESVMKKPVYVFCGDVHITDKKPIARCDEPDWEDAQFRVLDWLKEFCESSSATLVIGGDFLDKPVLPFSILNKIPEHLPMRCISVLGNHEQFDKRSNSTVYDSAWHTLSLMDVWLAFSKPIDLYDAEVQMRLGLIPATNSEEEFMEYVEKVQTSDIIVMHKYVWSKSSGGYPGANEAYRADNLSKLFPNAKWIFCSDNHKGFEECNVINCGMLIRDNADLIDYKPRVWVLYSDGTIEPMYAPIDKDLITDRHLVASKEAKSNEEIFIRTLGESKDISLSFEDNLKEVVDRLDSEPCKVYIMDTYESIKKGC